jgi:hypothetical protein
MIIWLRMGAILGSNATMRITPTGTISTTPNSFIIIAQRR